MTYVIFNADDFGRSPTINAAVERAHREGVLTSASLMVSGAALEEAIALAQRNPTLAVGLHLVMVSGRAVMPPRDIPHLVDSQGNFPPDPFTAGLRYASSPTVRRELRREIEAQFERFAATGLPLAHVDGHLHLHMHPFVLGWVLDLAEQYGARGIRLPRDDLWFSLSHDRRGASVKVAWALAFGVLTRWALRCLRGRHLVVTERVYGLMQTGQMEEAYVLKVLHSLRVSSAELYFHPDTAPQAEPLGPNPTDLAVLLSPTVRQVVQERGMQLATYLTLPQG